jgi:hypothetical protein
MGQEAYEGPQPLWHFQLLCVQHARYRRAMCDMSMLMDQYHPDVPLGISRPRRIRASVVDSRVRQKDCCT